jgi:broad specificity phosphatase PhoE
MSRVLLIRPGATAFDVEHRVQGVLDLPLSDRGRIEAAMLAEELSGVDLAGLYHGPGENVLHTAEAVGRATGIRPRRLDDLRNLDQGLWQGLLLDELRRRNPKVFRQWQEEPETICPPEGETIEEAHARLRPVLRSLIRRHRQETIAVVIPEPCARIVAKLLRREAELALDDEPTTGRCEWIEVHPDFLRNGDAS